MTSEMTTEMKMFKLHAPTPFTFCCVGKPNCCEKCYPVRDLFQTLVSKGGTFEIIDRKNALIGIPSTVVPLQATLLRNDIPIELLNIVDNYYGQNGGIEAILYPMIAKMVFMLYNDPKLMVASRLPCHNMSSTEFSAELYWYSGFEIGQLSSDVDVDVHGVMLLDNIFSSSTERYIRFCLDPVWFYKIYKETNNIGDEFILPTKPKDSPPSLVPHSFRHTFEYRNKIDWYCLSENPDALSIVFGPEKASLMLNFS
jgi:hypothetical protein